MNWLMGMGGAGRAPNPLIATSGKWLATCVAVYATIFWTPDVWDAWETTILRAVHDRYDGTIATVISWLLMLGAYPLMFFAVRMGLGVVFVSIVMGVMMKLFGGRR